MPCWCSRVAAPRPVGPPPTIRTETCGHRRMSSCRESTKAFSGPYLFCFWHTERRSRYRCLCSCQTSRLAALSAKRCNTSALQLFKLYIRPALRGASDVIGVSHCGVRKAVNMIAAAVYASIASEAMEADMEWYTSASSSPYPANCAHQRSHTLQTGATNSMQAYSGPPQHHVADAVLVHTGLAGRSHRTGTTAGTSCHCSPWCRRQPAGSCLTTQGLWGWQQQRSRSASGLLQHPS